ncbi:M50 family metallopeptidase [Paenibacillus ginsengihumi]|uniref:M50 family metallopeptidase n=1 Tax=Paenibacillus ginsengihumi TaxID=431596 RepID=UPI000369C908|nr:M50 family metallopeptidase [Paenibacillus ginsengihumi]
MGNWLITILLLFVSAFLTHLIPGSGFFRTLDTMIHEFGHAAVTLALSGKVMYIELYSNHSGVTYSQVTKPWSLIPIALSGYIGASLFAVFMFHARARGKQRLGLQMMTLLALLSLVLFVRNEYGVIWLVGFILLNLIMLALVPRWLRDMYYLLLAFLTLEESVFGPISLLMYAWQDPTQAGDATNLSLVTPMPAVGWALVFVLFSLWCAKQAIQSFLSRGQRRRPGGGEYDYAPYESRQSR